MIEGIRERTKEPRNDSASERMTEHVNWINKTNKKKINSTAQRLQYCRVELS